MSDLRDFTGKNRKFTGTKGERISTGTTGERVNEEGIIRYNSTTNLMEYYNGTDWKPIDSPPVITSFSIDSPAQTNVTSGYVGATQAGTFDLSINGSLFDTTGATVELVGTGENLSPDSLVRNSANLLTATYTASDLDSGNVPYTIKVTNGSGLSAELADAITLDNEPVFTNAADTTFVVNDGNRTGYSADCGATDADSDTITYSLSAGSLPTGASLNTASGAVTGASAVVSDTLSTFTIQAATSKATVTRQFKINVLAPVTQTYTSSTTLTVPSGSTFANVVSYVIGGGGGGAGGTSGNQGFSGGGGGGLAKHTGLTLTAATYPITVGAGGAGSAVEGGSASNGTASTFSTLTGNGGGGGTSNTSGGSGGTASGGTTNGTGGNGGVGAPNGVGGNSNGPDGSSGTNGAAGGGGGGTDASSQGTVRGGNGGNGSSPDYTGGGGGGGCDGDGTNISAGQRGIGGSGFTSGGNGGGQSQPAGQPGGGPSGGPGGSPTGTRNNSGGGGGSYGGGGGGAGSGDGGQVGGGHGAGGAIRLEY